MTREEKIAARKAIYEHIKTLPQGDPEINHLLDDVIPDLMYRDNFDMSQFSWYGAVPEVAPDHEFPSPLANEEDEDKDG